MTHTPADQVLARPYRLGEGALIPVAEADPFGFWLREIEAQAKGLTSYEIDGALVAVTGYQLLWNGVAYAFALINRPAVAGAGRQLAGAVRQRIAELMASDNLHRVQSTCDPTDRASAVFLRATGHRLESCMRRASHDGRDLHLYAIIRSEDYGQES